MNFKLTLTGPHSSGKTTLLEDLKEDGKLAQTTYLPEITRVIKSRGFNINEAGTNETQLLVTTTHLQNLFYNTSFIVDRCLLDGYVYTQWLYDHNKVDEWVLQFAENCLQSYISHYTHLFYIPKEFNVCDDGVRSADKLFHEEICNLFTATIDKYKLPVKTITGTREERKEKIYNILGV